VQRALIVGQLADVDRRDARRDSSPSPNDHTSSDPSSRSAAWREARTGTPNASAKRAASRW
jgi:hypothetical protein